MDERERAREDESIGEPGLAKESDEDDEKIREIYIPYREVLFILLMILLGFLLAPLRGD